MTNWSKLKVADLKEELKTRGIPLTGLKLKADFVAKLQELENDKEQDAEAEATFNDAAPESTVNQPADVPLDEPAVTKTSALDEDLQNEEAQEVEANELPSDTVLPEQVDMYSASQIKPTPSQPLTEIFAAQEEAKEEAEDDQEDLNTPKPVDNISTFSSTVPAAELIEDSKKRKRRSATPPLSTQDIALKKAKARDGTVIITKKESSFLEQIRDATDAAEAIQLPDGLGHDVPIEQHVPGSRGDADTLPSQSGNSTGDKKAALRSPPAKHDVVQDDRDVPPALHSATRSLYLRNFKRPLQIPALRKHLADLAYSKTAEDSIQLFHLDNIRTHALVSFDSIAAAARVRSYMHEKVFPDEASRMPIWLDYVPDEKIEGWITKEISANDRNKKWEVVYQEGADGMEAIHQEVNAAGPPRKPSVAQPRHVAISEVLSRPPPKASGVHPDRATLVPRHDKSSHDRGVPSRPEPEHAGVPESHPGIGFKALDELFFSTTAKPKLYYKPVPISVVDDRLDMMKDLRVPHSEMGKSGDEGMKRYSFEVYKGREEWVDKGPEFGYGARGVAALEGRRGRGGYRGGRGDRSRGGDSWRARY